MKLFGAFEDIFEGASGVVLGIGAVMVAPAVFSGARPLVKTLVKGGVYVADRARRVYSEAAEQLSDVVAEARSELSSQQGESESGRESSPATQPPRSKKERERESKQNQPGEATR